MRRFIPSFRRRGAELNVKPTVASLHELASDQPALMITNPGPAPAHHVVVSIRMRQSAFAFDEIETLAPLVEAPLLHKSSAARFTFEQAPSTTPHWLRIALRSIVKDAGTDLRIPLAIRYVTNEGVERIAHQTLHCDEELHLYVTKG